MKIVLWIGKEPNQIALAHKINEQFEVVGIVYEQKNKKKRLTVSEFFQKIRIRIFYSFIPKTWVKILNHYAKTYPKELLVESLTVENINNKKVKYFTEKLDPDVIAVSGTRLIKGKNIEIKTHKGIVNLHTGLSPYIKGGPNCTNWCISKGWTHLIGNSIMWLDEGIDSGNLILTEKTKISGNETFYELHLKVMEHAHDLYLQALNKIKRNNAKSVPQNQITKGITFYSKNWNIKAHIDLKINWKRFKKLVNKQKSIKVIEVK